MMVARVVLPSPGGPKSSTWSSASPRDLAASSAMASCSLAFDWPMNSPSQRGRSLSSKPCSSSARAALTRRSGVLSRAMAMLKRSVAVSGGWGKVADKRNDPRDRFVGLSTSHARVSGRRVALVDGMPKGEQVAVWREQQQLPLPIVLIRRAMHIARRQLVELRLEFLVEAVDIVHGNVIA